MPATAITVVESLADRIALVVSEPPGSLVAHLGGRELLDRIPAIVYIDETDATVSAGYRNVYISAHFETLLGYTAAELEADPEVWPSAIHPEDRAATLATEARGYATGKPLDQEFRLIARDGRVVWVSDRATFLADADGRARYCVGVISDISERKRLEAVLADRALSDALTGLPNRAHFGDRVEHALAAGARSGRPCAVLFVDLDRFKIVNDSLGHAAGDRLLVAVAERLRRHLRDADSIARLGGDEFAILLEAIDAPDQAIRFAERLVDALAAPFGLAGQEVIVRASVGIAVSGSMTADADGLLRAADLAMYQAKAAGGNGHALFAPSLHAAALERLALERDLRVAVASGSLTLAYQPIVELRGERIVGVEALLRWPHPGRGLVSPAEFLTLAEETGLIVPIGNWVRATACRAAAGWLRNRLVGTAFTVNVNVAPRELVEPDFVRAVRRTLAEAGLPPERLVLEVVETSVHHAGEGGVAALRELRGDGVGVALDHFGTGYSSLGQLASLPASVLKLDRSFIAELTGSSAQSALVEAVIRLGHALGHRVIAEGIETERQAEHLRELGVDEAQGYRFGRPVDAHETGERLRAQPARAPRGSRRRRPPAA